MNPDSREFILKNYRKLSSRQIAKRLNLPRTEIDKFIHEVKQRTPVEPEGEQPLSKSKEFLIAGCIFAAALLLRVFYIYHLKATPFFEPLSKTIDDGVYNLMAQEMSRGNWIGNFPFSAYRIPLYPYILAVIYFFSGQSLMAVHLIQSLAGALTPVLIYFIAKETFGSVKTGTLGAVMACFYMPFVFFENLLLGEGYSILLNLLGLLLILRALKSGEKVFLKAAVSGLLLGLSILLRPNTLIPVFFLGVYLYFVSRAATVPVKRCLALSAVFLAAAVLPMAPVAVKNYYLYKDFIPVSAVGGINLYIGNNPEADGKFALVKGVGTSLGEMVENSEKIAKQGMGRVLKPSAVSSYWARKAAAYAFSSPGHFLELLLIKIAFFFNNYEFPDILNIYFTAQFIPFLQWSPVVFGVIAILAFYGILCSFEQRNPKALLLGVFLIGYLFSVILFFVTSRYRLPAVPVLIVFAAFGLYNGICDFRFWRARPLVKLALVSCGAAIFTFWPVEKTSFGTDYNSLAIALKNKGDFESAERYYRKAMEIEPNYPSPYYNLALLLDKLGRPEEAAPLYKKHEELKREVMN